MRKRTLGILLAGMMALSVAACGGSAGAGNQENQEAGDAARVTESTEVPATTSADETETATTAEAPEASEDMSGTTEEAQAEQNTGENDADASGTAGSNILVAYFTYGENADLGDNVDASSSASIQMLDGQVTGNTGVVASVIADLTGADTFSIRTVESYPDNYNDTIDQGQEEQQEDVRPELSGQIENLDSYDTIFLGYPNWWGDMPMAIYSFLDEYDLSGKTIVPFVTSGGSGFSRSVEEIEDAEPDAEVLEGLSLSDSEATDAQRDVEEWLGELGYLG
mgnify:CR=1 FL=1